MNLGLLPESFRDEGDFTCRSDFNTKFSCTHNRTYKSQNRRLYSTYKTFCTPDDISIRVRKYVKSLSLLLACICLHWQLQFYITVSIWTRTDVIPCVLVRHDGRSRRRLENVQKKCFFNIVPALLIPTTWLDLLSISISTRCLVTTHEALLKPWK